MSGRFSGYDTSLRNVHKQNDFNQQKEIIANLLESNSDEDVFSALAHNSMKGIMSIEEAVGLIIIRRNWWCETSSKYTIRGSFKLFWDILRLYQGRGFSGKREWQLLWMTFSPDPHLAKGEEEIKDAIKYFKNLEGLLLLHGIRTEISPVVFTLDTLKHLRLDYNRLEKLPKMSEMKSLVSLTLSTNKFEEIPTSILEIPNLEILKMNVNPLRSIPADISKLKKLRILELANTKIKELPESIGDMQNLRTLCLNYTSLKMLPMSIERLKSLEVLELKGVALDTVRGVESLLKIPNLRRLQVKNPLPVFAFREGFKSLETLFISKEWNQSEIDAIQQERPDLRIEN